MGLTETFCANCHARLAEGAEWCTQCYTPVPGAQNAPPPGAAPTSEQVPTAGAAGGSAPADGKPERMFEDPRLGKTPTLGDTKHYETPEFSRWKSGPGNFGPLGKSLLTVGLVVGLVLGFTLVHGAVYAFTGFIMPPGPFRIFYAIPATLFGSWCATKIWKRSRIK